MYENRAARLWRSGILGHAEGRPPRVCSQTVQNDPRFVTGATAKER